MNDEQLKRYVIKTRDCDEALIDIAINKGVKRAKNDSIDFAKILHLALKYAVVAVICFVLNLEPVRIRAENFLLDRSIVTRSDSEMLHTYFGEASNLLITYIGGN